MVNKTSDMSKQYGLIIPGQQQKTTAPTVREPLSKPSIFDESSSSDDENRPQMKLRAGAAQGPSLMERRMARSMQEKALKEDPTVFQYDELYDEMEQEREQQQQVKSNEPKKPKYVGRLMEYAERRKLENELRIERQVQKEREEEGEEFKDKERFVTAAYRKKLEEMRKLQLEEKRDEYLEAIGDVTKQKDLDGFYRHLYEQKVGSAKDVQKPELPKMSAGDEDEVAYKPIKSGRSQQQRAYRKRRASEEEDDEAAAPSTAPGEAKKVHLQNNIDADSDFSIDSSTDESDEDDADDAKKAKSAEAKLKLQKDGNNEAISKAMAKTSVAPIAINLDALKKEKDEDTNAKDAAKSSVEELAAAVKAESALEAAAAKPKRDKNEIWKKRTVGEVYEAAVKRYFERRSARSA